MICKYRYYEDEPDRDLDPRYYVRMKIYDCSNDVSRPLIGCFYNSSCPRRCPR